MKFLLLWFEAPLQSWGYDSKFDLRRTFSFPTKSGVFGLLLSASGDSGPQCELLERMRNAEFIAVSLENPVTANTPNLNDYHMIGSGYKSNWWESLNVPRKHNSPTDKEGVSASRQTHRHYLQNKKFAVILGLEDDLAEKFAASLKAPVFDLYLGRKCCVPTEFIFQGLFDMEDEAWAAMEKLAESKKLKPDKKLMEVDQANSGSLHENVLFLSDVPLEFGLHKRYADRCVQIVKCEKAVSEGF